MCNVWNSGGNARNGCRCGGFTTVNTINTTNTTGNTGGCCGCWNGTWQRMCRDACGNIFTRNIDNGCGWQRMCRDACGNIFTRNTNNGCGCGCQHCCHHCPCGCTGGNGGGGGTTTGNNGGATGGNGNGVFRCITFCGFGNGLTQTTGTTTRNNTDAYYARQYGLTCDDNAECVYNF